jgi:hypothetical protein
MQALNFATWVYAIIRITAIILLLILYEIMSSQKIGGACKETKISIHELIIIVEIVFKNI